jgi:hypothetical protein
VRALKKPAIVGWAIATDDVGELKQTVEAAGFCHEMREGSRRRADGRLLRWRLLFLVDAPPLAPFAIAWSANSSHPSDDSPSGNSGGACARDRRFRATEKRPLSLRRYRRHSAKHRTAFAPVVGDTERARRDCLDHRLPEIVRLAALMTFSSRL